MTIAKKLYISFGAVLAMVLVLFLVNYLAVRREHSAKAAASQALERAESTDKIRSQMMQNRLYLSSYLLSGDTRMVDRMREGIEALEQELHHAMALGNSDQQRSALLRVQQSEQSWAQDFASPLVDKRKQVDGGNATVAELQIFYLQKDASSWLKNKLNFSTRPTAKIIASWMSARNRTRLQLRQPSWWRCSARCSRLVWAW